MSTILTVNNLKNRATEGNAIIISKLKFDKNKKPSAIFLNSKDNNTHVFAFETPYMTISFSANYYGENDADKFIPEDQRNYSFTFSVNGGSKLDNPEENEAFISFLEDLKNTAIEFGIENSSKLCKRTYTPAQREAFFDSAFTCPIKQKAKDDGTLYPLSVLVKAPKNKDTHMPDFSFYSDNGGNIREVKLSSWDEVKQFAPKGSHCKAIIRPYLTFQKNVQFTLRIVQMKVIVVEKMTIPKSYAFSDAPLTIENQKSSSKTNDSNLKSNTDEMVNESDNENHVDDVDVDVTNEN